MIHGYMINSIASHLTQGMLQMGGEEQTTALGKTVLPIVLWDKLDSTPYGRNMMTDGSYVIKPVDQKLAELQRSHIPMDHYNIARGKELCIMSSKLFKQSVCLQACPNRNVSSDHEMMLLACCHLRLGFDASLQRPL
jgi:hypothetical protein